MSGKPEPAEAAAWHYTVGHKLAPILAAGQLLPFGAKCAPGEAPVLWFSLDSFYEPTAIKLVQLNDGRGVRRPTMQELHSIIGLYRFRLDRASEQTMHWSKVVEAAEISPSGTMSLIAAGIELGATPNNWLGRLEPLSIHDLVFEAWDGRRWIESDLVAEVELLAARAAAITSVSAGDFGHATLRQAWTGREAA